MEGQGNKNTNTWSRGEKQLLLVAFIVLLYHFNVFNFFHGQQVDDDEAFQYLTGISNTLMSNELLDTVGKNWVPIKDRDTLRCSNLDSLIKRRGTANDDEQKLWEDLACESKLADLYLKWEQNNKQMKQHCDKWKEDYGIDVGIDWGFASTDVMDEWKQSRCDCHYPAGWKEDCLYGLPPTVHETTTPAGIDAAADARPAAERLSPPPDASGLPVIAIVLGTTSRGYRWEQLSDSPLVRIFLSSVARSLEPGFEYRIYAGFDVGDLYYDNDEKLAELRRWFDRHVAEEAKGQGVVVQLAMLRFLNILRKPGPIFNFLTASAYMDGADYFYRINDDTEFRTPWAGAMVTALSQFSPPNVGVVGPVCYDGNQNILTHDFVHRTHRNIFQTYYPVVFTDWWMDDWISMVYPRDNTLRHSQVAVSHHTWMTGGGDPVRYQVDHTHKVFLDDELRRGLREIGAFSEKHCSRGTCDALDGHVTPKWTGTYEEEKQKVFDSLFDFPNNDFQRVWEDVSESSGFNNSFSDDGFGGSWSEDDWGDLMEEDYLSDEYYKWEGGLGGGYGDQGSDWEVEVNITDDSAWANEAPDDEWVSGLPLGRGPGSNGKKASGDAWGGRKRPGKPQLKGGAFGGGGGQEWSHEETEEKVTDALRQQIKRLEDLAKSQAHNLFVPRGRQEEEDDDNKSEDAQLLAKIEKMEKDILQLKEEYTQRVAHREAERKHDIARMMDSTQSVGPLTSSQVKRASVVLREEGGSSHGAPHQDASPPLPQPRHPVLSDKAAKLVKHFAKSRKKQKARERASRRERKQHSAGHEELREKALLDMMEKEAMEKAAGQEAAAAAAGMGSNGEGERVRAGGWGPDPDVVDRW